jgi:hypothetical protein
VAGLWRGLLLITTTSFLPVSFSSAFTWSITSKVGMPYISSPSGTAKRKARLLMMPNFLTPAGLCFEESVHATASPRCWRDPDEVRYQTGAHTSHASAERSKPRGSMKADAAIIDGSAKFGRPGGVKSEKQCESLPRTCGHPRELPLLAVLQLVQRALASQ